jgi:hypothetical protein
MPVGTNALSRGLSVMGSARLARRSIPADEGVLYEGSGFDDLFMIFTVILLTYQLVTAENHIWAIYFIELMMVLVMAPLKVFVVINKTINKKIMEEFTDISKVEE